MHEPTTTTTLMPPEVPERCCATCRWWVMGRGGSAWCLTIAAALLAPLEHAARLRQGAR